MTSTVTVTSFAQKTNLEVKLLVKCKICWVIALSMALLCHSWRYL